MNQERCPNCRSSRSSNDETCEHCGWVPLRATELLFVERDQVVCPRCSKPRPAAANTCPNCGAQHLLEELSQNARNFHISKLLWVTALVGVCLAIYRITPFLGIPAFMIAGCATLRVALLLEERKKHRYSVKTRDMLRLFGGSVGGILAALFAFGGSWFALSIFGVGVATAASQSFEVFIALVAILLAATHVPANIWAWKSLGLRPCLTGVFVAVAGGSFVAVLWGPGLGRWLILLPLLSALLGSSLLACRRGGGARAMAYVVGHSSGLVLVGVVGIALNGVSRRYDFAEAFVASGFILLPTLAAGATLRGLWSWDSAFPTTIFHRRPLTSPLRMKANLQRT